MSCTVTVIHLIAGTVTEDAWTAERITVQTWPGGRALLKLHRGGQVVEDVGYAHAERIHRTTDRKDAP